MKAWGLEVQRVWVWGLEGYKGCGSGDCTLDPSSSHLSADITPSYEGSGQTDWVERERRHFTEQRDKDKDGRLNREELRQWMAPDGYDPVEAETNHLIYEADTNKVGCPVHAV